MPRESLPKTVLQRLEVKNFGPDGDERAINFLDNDAIRPTRICDRTWSHWTYLSFWFSATATTANWYAASTGLTAGLGVWESLGCTFAGQILAGLLLALNGRAGALYRIPFPVFCRSSFGVYGAYWPTFNRAVMSIVWNGVTTVQGAQCVYVMIHAIAPSFENIPNVMGPKSALTSAQMISLAIFWLFNCAFLFIEIPKMKKLVYVKLIVFVISAIAMLAWVVTLAGGVGVVVNQPSKIHGSEKAWTIVKFLFLGLASCSTFISNAADFQRYARRPNDTILGQVVGFPISNFIVSLVGTIVAASSKSILGELEWNPIMFLDKLMAGERRTPANRAGCFFISACFVYSNTFSAIFENSIPAGHDIASLLPRYINIRRGFLICAVFSIAICPWYLLGSAAVFINFLGSYQVFLSSITGILICDYYILRRGRLDIPSLFTASKDGPAYYFHGFNLRAFSAYILAVAPNFYGFLNQLGVPAVIEIQRVYYFAYPLGVLLSLGLYSLASIVANPAVRKLGPWNEPMDYVDEFDESLHVLVLEAISRDPIGVDVSLEDKKSTS
ncbi:permease [Paramyrothecium foliicola]|nr:permease [Paramyrothecium foliicola]